MLRHLHDANRAIHACKNWSQSSIDGRQDDNIVQLVGAQVVRPVFAVMIQMIDVVAAQHEVRTINTTAHVYNIR